MNDDFIMEIFETNFIIGQFSIIHFLATKQSSPELAQNIMNEYGLTIDDFEQAGIDSKLILELSNAIQKGGE